MVQTTGSEELKKSMPYGALKQMAEVFNCSVGWIGRVVSGKETSDEPIVACAKKLSKIKNASDLKITKIISTYEKVNETRN